MSTVAEKIAQKMIKPKQPITGRFIPLHVPMGISVSSWLCSISDFIMLVLKKKTTHE